MSDESPRLINSVNRNFNKFPANLTQSCLILLREFTEERSDMEINKCMRNGQESYEIIVSGIITEKKNFIQSLIEENKDC